MAADFLDEFLVDFLDEFLVDSLDEFLVSLRVKLCFSFVFSYRKHLVSTALFIFFTEKFGEEEVADLLNPVDWFEFENFKFQNVWMFIEIWKLSI